MFGALTLGAQQAPAFTVAFLGSTLSGEHCAGRYNGRYELGVSASLRTEVAIPSRDKHIDVWSEGSSVARDFFTRQLAQLDSQYPGATWRTKLLEVQAGADPDHVIVLNTTSTHSTFSLIAGTRPLYVLGVYDPNLKTSHLVWSSIPIERQLRQHFPLSFYYYRFPVLVGGVVFIPTQVVCSHWYRYCKSSNDLLFAFNALEVKLFRELS